MTSLSASAQHTLNDGTTLPVIGFGTYELTGAEGVTAMRHALDAGYRMLDTAVNYRNEEAVGEALARSGLDRGGGRVGDVVRQDRKEIGVHGIHRNEG